MKVGYRTIGYALGVAFAFVAQPALAALPSLESTLDAVRVKTGTPGVAVAIVKKGSLIWHGESGVADERTGALVGPSTMFSLASVSKLFTVAMAFKLVERGSLRLDDPISRFISPAPPGAAHVTVEELLGHTSGYADAEDDPWMLRRLDDPNYPWTRAAVVARQSHPRTAPGTKYSYCNSCYVILGGVIESAGNASIAAQLDTSVVTPLGLSGQVDIARTSGVAPRIARGYDLQARRLVDVSTGARDLGVATSVWGPVWTDGGVVATAAGVARFTDALFRGDVVTPASVGTMLEPGGHGIIVESYKLDGRTWRGHSGFYYGYTAETWFDASRCVTITVLANRTDDLDPATEIWNRIASAFDREDDTRSDCSLQ